MKTFKFDIMLDGRFVCSMSYTYSPLFRLDIDDLVNFIESKRPSLKGKDYQIEYT